MGALCAVTLARHGEQVVLWGRSKDRVEEIRAAGENAKYLPGTTFPKSIRIESDPKRAFGDASIIVSAVPCQHIRSVWNTLKPYVPRDVPIVSVAKGIELDTLLTSTQIIEDCVASAVTACLSGPCIASEVAAEKPTGLVAASRDVSVAEMVQRRFSSPCLRVYTSSDLAGVEIAGAVKNVIALAAGISDGINAGDNAKASLLTRGLVEISRLGVAMGANVETFRGLAGVGDLFTTCVSRIGRNRTAGEAIGRGVPVDEVIASTDSVVEGIPTTKGVLTLANRHQIEMPIVEAVASVLFEGATPQDAITSLMTRQLRPESLS